MAQDKITVDSMLKHLRPFVPATVQRIVERNPGAPEFEKRDIEVTVLFLDIAGYTRISETQTRGKVNFIIENTGIPTNFGITVFLGFVVGIAIVGLTFSLFLRAAREGTPEAEHPPGLEE